MRKLSANKVIILGTVLLCAVLATARAERQVVDRVVAVVEDEAIFQSDVDEMVKQMAMQRSVMNMPELGEAELEKEALEELVNNQLVIAKASELGIQVSFTEVEKMVDQAIEDNKRTLGGSAAFTRQLEAENLTLDGLKQLYRKQIRNRVLVERVLAREIDRSSIQVTEEELREAYEERGEDLPLRPAVVNLATIFFSMESSDHAREVAKKKIDEIHDRIVAGEDFAELARELSEDPSAEGGGALGSLNLDDLSNREFAVAAATLSVGEVSDPVLTPFGYHLIKVTGKNPDTGEVELSHILIRIKPGDDDVQSVYDKATEVHQKLTDGADFAEMAREYSNDTATAEKGGDLGWLRIGDLPEFFREVLAGMHVGDISSVLREPAGFRIVKLMGHEDARPYAYDELRDELKKYVEQERMASKFNDYVASLRDQFYVDVRI